MRQLVVFAAIATAIPAAVIAGGTAVIESQNRMSAGMPATESRTEVQWQDEATLRFGLPGEPGYMLVRDGSAYVVMQEGGQTRVLDMSAMRGMMQAAAGAGAAPGTDTFGSIDSLEATNETEAVAGIEGEVYRVTHTDAEGETVTEDWVLTGDPLVAEMTRSYLASIEAMVGTEAMGSIREQFQNALPDNRRGLLRAGEGFRLVSISDEEPAADTFELPAEPMDMQQMMQGMGNR